MKMEFILGFVHTLMETAASSNNIFIWFNNIMSWCSIGRQYKENKILRLSFKITINYLLKPRVNTWLNCQGIYSFQVTKNIGLILPPF